MTADAQHGDATPTLQLLAAQPAASAVLGHLLHERRTHALLLSGTPGTGVVEAAQWIARSALCPQGIAGGDGCSTCGRVDRRTHPDLHWVVPEGAQLRLAQVKEVVDQAVRRPFEAHAQVMVIEDADTLSRTNPDAGNALLKVLEEPPGDVLFVLVAERPALMLPTIRSRVMEVRLPPLPDAQLRAVLDAAGLLDAGALAARGLGAEAVVRMARGDAERGAGIAAGAEPARRAQLAAELVLRLAEGQLLPADASAMLLQRIDEVRAAAEHAAEVQLEADAERMPPKDAQRFRSTSDDAGMQKRVKRQGRRAAGIELRRLLDEVAACYRDLMAMHAGADATLMVAAARPAELAALRDAPAAVRAVAALDAIDEVELRTRLNVDTAVAIDALCAELAGLAEGRIRARRTLGAPSRTPQGVDLALG